jgi:hypothetical protein
MIQFLTGVVVGIIISTIGVSEIAKLLDEKIENFKTVIKEQSK